MNLKFGPQKPKQQSGNVYESQRVIIPIQVFNKARLVGEKETWTELHVLTNESTYILFHFELLLNDH